MEPDLHVQIIVIDDGSPVHAAADLDGAPPPCPAIEMICVRQANGGCAAARNAGLALAASDSGAIAFLDSDDIWAPNHLATAVAAISEGFDFYFSDHSRDDFYPSYFEEIGFPGSMPTTGLSLSGHQICEVAQRDFFEFFLKRYVPQISTVVYRRSIAPGGIFSSALKFASEDYLFLLSLVQAATRVCYGLEDKARCGAGINVYYSTFSWDDEGHIRRHMGDLLGTYAIRSDLQLTAEGEALIDKRIVDLRRLNAFFLLRWALKGRLSWFRRPSATCPGRSGLLEVAPRHPSVCYPPAASQAGAGIGRREQPLTEFLAHGLGDHPA